MSSPNRSYSRRQFKQGDQPSQFMQRAAQAVLKELPKEFAFALLAFPLDTRDGGLRYVSTGDRQSVIELMRAFVAKADAGKMTPPAAEGN